MRGPVSLVAVLSALATLGSALPQLGMVPRADTTTLVKPKYSVVPLEPGDDDPQSGNSGDGENSTKDSYVTKTIVKTEDPATQTVTKTGQPITVTRPTPTTISVIPIGGKPDVTVTVTAEVTPTLTSTTASVATPTTTTTVATPTTTTVVTPTAEVTPTATFITTTTTTTTTTTQANSTIATPTSFISSKSSMVAIPTSLTDIIPSMPTGTPPAPLSTKTWSVPSSNHTTTSSDLYTETSKTAVRTTALFGTGNRLATSIAVPVPTTTKTKCIPTTLSTVVLTTPSSSISTNAYDDGKWHSTYPPWNGTVIHRFRRV